jgi:hypothetical protein
MFQATEKLPRNLMIFSTIGFLMVGMLLYLLCWYGTYHFPEKNVHNFEIVLINDDEGFQSGFSKINWGEEMINRFLHDKKETSKETSKEATEEQIKSVSDHLNAEENTNTLNKLIDMNIPRYYEYNIQTQFQIIQKKSLEETFEEMKMGKYSLVLHLPKSFSEDVHRLSSGESVKPTIHSYINQGKNIISASEAQGLTLGVFEGIKQSFQQNLIDHYIIIQVEDDFGDVSDVSSGQLQNLAHPLYLKIHYINPVKKHGLRGLLPMFYVISIWMFTFFFCIFLGMAFRGFRDLEKIWTTFKKSILIGFVYSIGLGSTVLFGTVYLFGMNIQFPLGFFLFSCYLFLVVYFFVLGAMYLFRIFFLPLVLILFFIWLPSSGLTFPTEYMTGFMEWVHQWNLLGLAENGARSLIYYESSTPVWESVGYLTIYLGAGFLMILGKSLYSSNKYKKQHKNKSS